MVVDTRFELVTPAMSMQCSTTELIDHPIWKAGLLLLRASSQASTAIDFSRRSGRHHALDFIDELAQVEGLGENFCARRGRGAAR